MTSIRLTPTPPRTPLIDALAARHGGRVGLAGVTADLTRIGRRTWAPGRCVRWAMTWDRTDRSDRDWWPQGVTSSADAGLLTGPDRVAGRRLVLTSWYSKAGDGCRLSVVDPDRRRYQHVLLARVTDDGEPAPLRAHAGGIAWIGPWVFVAATRRGFHVAHLDDVVAMRWRGHSYVLPIRFTYTPTQDDGEEPLRFSFLSLAQGPTFPLVEPGHEGSECSGPGVETNTSAPQLFAGEYGRGSQTTRLLRFPLDPETGLLALDADGSARPSWHHRRLPRGSQGAVVARDRYLVSVSRGGYRLGHLHHGEPGTLRCRRWALPVGPEDLAFWPGRDGDPDRLWTVTEHPGRRWLVALALPRAP